jgi:hypothetical protein
MNSANIIRDAVGRVAHLRAQAHARPNLSAAILDVKQFQSARFAATYSDLLNSKDFSGPTRFFLTELYSANDYAVRDAQFARIAGALQTFFPDQVVATAVSLAQLHVLTEEMDFEMALAWLGVESVGVPACDSVCKYVKSWANVDRRQDRERQLSVVITVGKELVRLTRTRGLRIMLRMMHRPANVAGLASLQSFLESGFDTFAAMASINGTAQTFLDTICERESKWINLLSANNFAESEAALRNCLSPVNLA